MKNDAIPESRAGFLIPAVEEGIVEVRGGVGGVDMEVDMLPPYVDVDKLLSPMVT